MSGRILLSSFWPDSLLLYSSLLAVATPLAGGGEGGREQVSAIESHREFARVDAVG